MTRSLHDELRAGGYILYSRHGEATIGEDQGNLDFKSCTTQRNLSVIGRRQAVFYGQIIQNLEIPIHYPVKASPFCRVKETAQLAFGKDRVELDPFGYDIYKLSHNITPNEQKDILRTLTTVLDTIPPKGYNQVIIAHGFPDGVGLGHIPDMGTVIVKPLGKNHGYKVVGKFSLAELASLYR